MAHPSTTDPLEVLVAEGSLPLQQLLVALLTRSGFTVVAAVNSGRAALTAAERLRPDVIVMDVALSDSTTTQQIMQRCPTPIVLVSSAAGDPGLHAGAAMAAGAVAVVQMPGGPHHPDHARDHARLATMVRIMAHVPVVTRFAPSADLARSAPMPLARPAEAGAAPHSPKAPTQPRILAMAASTGGPQTLQRVLCDLGAGFPLPIVIVQHITVGFAATMAEWLTRVAPFQARIAQERESVQAGRVYVAPDSAHLTLNRQGQIILTAPSPGERYCPSADRLFASVASAYGPCAIGVILTGMGDDGAEGLHALRASGGFTLGQEAASCVVPGMPVAAAKRGAVEQAQPLAHLASAVWDRLATHRPATARS